MCTQTTLNIIASRFVQAARDSLGEKLDKVILYGSYACGDYDNESDIDIMVLADIPHEDCWGEYLKISKRVGYLDLEYDTLTSIHVTDCKTFYEYIDVLPFYMNVIRDGVTLYAA